MTEEVKMVKLLSNKTIYDAMAHMNLTEHISYKDYSRFPYMKVDEILSMLEVNRTDLPKEILMLGNMTFFDIIEKYAGGDLITYEEYQKLPNMTGNQILAAFNLTSNGIENLRIIDIIKRVTNDQVMNLCFSLLKLSYYYYYLL